jgi:hypothetical protein
MLTCKKRLSVAGPAARAPQLTPGSRRRTDRRRAARRGGWASCRDSCEAAALHILDRGLTLHSPPSGSELEIAQGGCTVRPDSRFGKRTPRQGLAANASGESSSVARIWPVALAALLAIACVFAARTYFPPPGQNPTTMASASGAAEPAADSKAGLDRSEEPPFEFLKGRWVTSRATCQATDNYIDFDAGGYKAHLHEREWLNYGGRGSFWRRGSLLMVMNGGNTRAAILIFKYVHDNEIGFYSIVFDQERNYDEYAFHDPDQPRGSDLAPQFHSVATKLEGSSPRPDPNEEWRQRFRTYLGTLKRCAKASPQ